MAKRLTDEQKLFFGTKAQRAAVKRKHPSWAKDKSGFRQTVNGKHHNPFKTKTKSRSTAPRKTAPRKTAPRKTAPRSTAPRVSSGGGGSTTWLTGDQLLAKKDLELKAALKAGDKIIDKAISTVVPGGLGETFKQAITNFDWFSITKPTAFAGPALAVPGLPGVGYGRSPNQEGLGNTGLLIPEILESNQRWIDAHPDADPYGIYDPQYAIA